MIYGEGIRLRAPERTDLERFTSWFNDPEVRGFLARFAPLSLAQEEIWFERQLQKSDGYLLVIEVLEGQAWTPIGNCGLESVDWHNRSAVLGIMLGEKVYWGRGHGTAAVGLLVDFAFDDLNLERVELDVYDFNVRARRCYEKCGFRLEGTRRRAKYVAGEYHDVHRMGLLRDDLRANRSRSVE